MVHCFSSLLQFSFPIPHLWFTVQRHINVTLKRCVSGTNHCGVCGYRAFISLEWLSVIPHGSRIYYIWNSVVFPFNTESKKTARLSVHTNVFIEIIPMKCQTCFTFISMTMHILLWWTVLRAHMTRKDTFFFRKWHRNHGWPSSIGGFNRK